MDNIVSAKLDSRYASTLGVWQYDYGQVLRITGPELPPAVEVQFSLDEKSGETLSRVGTTVDGVTEVKIPDELLKHSATSNYRIYAYIYLTDETSGNTKYEITIPVRVRSKPTSPAEDPETDPDLFRETVVAVNASAERAENAASSAMESAASADETLAEIKRVADGISGNIENANTMKSELSDMINNAGIEKKELESSIGKAGEVKMALDSSIRSAGEKQLALDTTVEHANTVDASLKEHIGSAEQIQANVEQIANNKEDIGSLQEELGDIESKFEIETEAFSNKCSIIRNNTPNNFTGNQITGVKQYFDFGENAALTKIKMNIKASNDDTVVLEIATLDGNIIATAEKAVTTEYTDVVFDLENIVIKEPVSVFVYTKGTNLLSYGLYATPYDDQSFSYIFPDGTRKSAFKIGTSEIPKPTTSNNKQCLVLFFDYTSKIIKNISDSISQNIDTTLLKSGKAADAKVVGDKLSKLEEDLSNKITKFYASNQGENHLADSDNGKIMDMMLYGRSEQKQYSGKNLAHGKNENYYINNDTSLCGFNNNDIGMAIDVSNLTSVTISTRSIQDRYRIGCVDTVPTKENVVTCYNGKRKDGTKDSYTIDTTDYNYLIVNATKLEDIQVEKGSEATYYEPYTGGIPSPSPDYPQEIKRVVNPTMKVCGKNLWDNFKTLSLGNVEQKNGTYIATADTMQVDITSSSIGARPLLLKANNAYTFSLKTTVSISSPKFVCLRYTNGEINNIIFTNKNFVNFVPERDVEKIGFILYESVAGDKAYDVQLEMGSEATAYEPYTEQSVQLPYTLNAIPVASGGNVTIDGQQYVADYVDVERGKVVRMCGREALNTKNGEVNEEYRLAIYIGAHGKEGDKECILSTFKWTSWETCVSGTSLYIKNIKKPNDELYTAQELKELSIDFEAVYQLKEKQEIDLTTEQAQALKELVTNYPVTNISVTSDQLDGYAVFNYPISMQNGWNYVKQQLNDNRDYIYDMDIQSAEAYVNSEYAVALTELEV